MGRDAQGLRERHFFIDAVSSSRLVKVAFSRPFLRSFAPVMPTAATSQQTAAVPAKACGATRLYLSEGPLNDLGDQVHWEVKHTDRERGSSVLTFLFGRLVGRNLAG